MCIVQVRKQTDDRLRKNTRTERWERKTNKEKNAALERYHVWHNKYTAETRTHTHTGVNASAQCVRIGFFSLGTSKMSGTLTRQTQQFQRDNHNRFTGKMATFKPFPFCARASDKLTWLESIALHLTNFRVECERPLHRENSGAVRCQLPCAWPDGRQQPWAQLWKLPSAVLLLRSELRAGRRVTAKNGFPPVVPAPLGRIGSGILSAIWIFIENGWFVRNRNVARSQHNLELQLKLGIYGVHKPFIWIDMARNVHYLSGALRLIAALASESDWGMAYFDVAYKSLGIASNDNGGCFVFGLIRSRFGCCHWGEVLRVSLRLIFTTFASAGFYCVCCGPSSRLFFFFRNVTRLSVVTLPRTHSVITNYLGHREQVRQLADTLMAQFSRKPPINPS